MLDERFLAAAVAVEHRADLRHRGVRLVDEQQVILREEIEQRVRRLARLAPAQRPAVVLDPRAVAHLHHHLDVVPRPRAEPLGLEQLALRLEQLQPLAQLLANLVDRVVNPLLRQHEVLGRVDVHLLQLVDHFAATWD